MSRPVVSVIIPAYNAEEYIEEAVESVLGQGLSELQCIVVNDGSTDRTASILDKAKKWLLVIEQENRGVSAARNAGLAACTGEWIAFLDADDLWRPGKIKAQLADMAINPAARIHSTNLSLERDHLTSDDYFSLIKLPLRGGDCKIVDRPSDFLMKYHFAWLQSTLIHRTLIKEPVIYFDEALSIYEDFKWLLRVSLRSAWVLRNENLVEIKRRNSLGEPLSRWSVKNKLGAADIMADILEDHRQELISLKMPVSVVNAELIKQYSHIANMLFTDGKPEIAKSMLLRQAKRNSSPRLLLKYLLAALTGYVRLSSGRISV